MKISEAVAVALFNAMGYQTAAKWAKEGKLPSRLAKMDELVAAGKPDLKDKKQAKLLDQILKAVEAKEAFEVEPGPAVAEAPVAEAPAEEAKPTKKKAPPKPAATTATPGGAGKKKAPAKKAPKAAAEKKERPAKSATPKTGPAGVTLKKSMPYIAGTLIKKYGLEAGVTEAMVKEADAEAGRDNPHQTWFNLRNAFHAIRGYLGKPVNEKAEG